MIDDRGSSEHADHPEAGATRISDTNLERTLAGIGNLRHLARPVASA